MKDNLSNNDLKGFEFKKIIENLVGKVKNKTKNTEVNTTNEENNETRE